MLQRIVLEEFGGRVEWLWERVREQTYAFDDTVKGSMPAFLETLFKEDSAHWWCEQGMVSFTNIQLQINANVHFLLWDKEYSKTKLLRDARVVFGQMFEEFALRRLTATIPHFNPSAMRLAVALGMRYEGTVRECFLHNGEFYDMIIYGMLHREFASRKESHNGRNDVAVGEAN